MKPFFNAAPLVLPRELVFSSTNQPVKSKWHKFAWFMVALGIFFRLFHYLDNRSFWLDEIYLATSLIKMNFWELTAPMLEYEQKAPILFLWLERLCVLLFGKSEMALRLIPLLAGIASLLLFMPVARYFLKPLGVVVALAMLALAPPLIYHAVEAKQYSTELLATIIALYSFTRYHQKNDIKALLKWGLAGVVLLWFSFSSIFILAGIAIGCSLYYLIKKNWKALFRSLIPFTMWLVTFVIHFLAFSEEHIQSGWLIDWFQHKDAFMPFPPTGLADLKWFFQMIYRFMNYPMGLLWFTPDIHDNIIMRNIFRMMPLFLLLLMVGMFICFRQDNKRFFILIFPLVLTLLASGLMFYPVYDRLLVFLAPLAILLMARGCEYLTNLLPARAKWRYLLPALLLAGPFYNAVVQVINPELMDTEKNVGITRQHHRESFLYINERYQPGDVVYVYWNDLPPYRFYKATYNLKYTALQGRDVRFISKDINDYFNKLSPDFKPLLGKKRVWLVYDRHLFVNIGDYLDRPTWYFEANLKQPGKMLIHNKFAAMSKETDTYRTTYTNVSLFDLSSK